MAAASYDDLLEHVGHTVEVAYYGDGASPVNVAVECIECMAVIVDFDRPDCEGPLAVIHIPGVTRSESS